MTLQTYGHHNCDDDDDAVVTLARRCASESSLHEQPVAVEVGAWTGATTILLADLGFRTFAVDHWEGSADTNDGLYARARIVGKTRLFGAFCENVDRRLYRTVFTLIGDSLFHAKNWPRGLPISFLFIDADHRYEAVLADIKAWSPLVAPGGIIAGHDFGMFEGVNRAVIETGPFERAGDFVWWRKAEQLTKGSP